MSTRSAGPRDGREGGGRSGTARVAPVSPHNRAVYEAGKKLLVESIDVGRDFCKSMITISTGAIPVYIAMLKLSGIENIVKSSLKSSLWFLAISPCLLFLVASIIFILGYFPSTGTFSLDIVQEIENSRKRLLKRRKCFIVVGTVIFSVAVVISFITLIEILMS